MAVLTFVSLEVILLLAAADVFLELYVNFSSCSASFSFVLLVLASILLLLFVLSVKTQFMQTSSRILQSHSIFFAEKAVSLVSLLLKLLSPQIKTNPTRSY